MGPFDSGYRAFDSDLIALFVIVSVLSLGFKSVLKPLVIMRIVPWVGKVSDCWRG
jgi:hypothetical protein